MDMEAASILRDVRERFTEVPEQWVQDELATGTGQFSEVAMDAWEREDFISQVLLVHRFAEDEPGTCFCLIGACMQSATPTTHGIAALRRVFKALATTALLDHGARWATDDDTTVAIWNDEAGRTVQEVIDLIDATLATKKVSA